MFFVGRGLGWALINILGFQGGRLFEGGRLKYGILFWQLGAADEDEADSLIKEAEGSDDDEENDDDDLLPF